MKYLVIIFIIIIIIGLLANRELARDKKRIKRMMREYSFKTYSPEDTEEDHPKKETKEKRL
jgi:septin family protein